MAVDYEECRKAFLLLQLLGAEDYSMSKGDANKALTKGGNQALGMKEAKVANSLRESLCPTYIVKERRKTERGGTADSYRITDEGVAYLLTLSQYPLHIQIPGRAIDRLIAAAREGRPGATAEDNGKPLELDLRGEVLRSFQELHRERHARSGLVPIFEVRRMIADRLGPDAARHDRFDGAVFDLWRDKRLELVPINDMSRATADQLDDAIPESNVVWFFLENKS